MKIALVSSLSDPGGCTIHEAILGLVAAPHRLYPLERHDISHHRIGGRLIFGDQIDRGMDADLIIFLSRHSSKNPVPVLTVHVTGNITTADFGGRIHSLAPAAPRWMHAVIRVLSENAPPGYRVSYEVTHHGPTELGTPSLFVEVGSTEKEWEDKAAGAAVATSVLSADPVDCIPLIGFGGTHYAARQTHISLNSRGAFGHIVHTRDVPSIDAAMVGRLLEKTGAVAAYVDRKAIPKKDLARLESILAERGIRTIAEGDLMHFGDLRWGTYLKILSIAEETVPGSRVILHGQLPDGEPGRIDLDPLLLDEAWRCSQKGFLDGLDTLPLARLSTRKKPIWPSFITIGKIRANVLHDLISLCVYLIRRGEITFVEGNHLTICRRRFDPDRARDLGVPPGPLYGQLMNGCTVYLGNREITPAMVQTSCEKRIHIPGLEMYL